MWKFISQWQELVVWIPLLLLSAWGLTVALPQLDPRTGVDGLGFLGGINEDLIKVAVIFFLTWLFIHTYSASTEEQRRDNALQMMTNHGVLFYIVENVRVLVALLVVVYCFSH